MAASSVRRRLLGAGVIVALLVGVLLAVPLLVPRSTVRRIVLRTVDRACACRASVGGRFDLTLWPGPGLVATRLRIANPRGFGPGALLTVRRLTLRAAWAPLLHGRWGLASARFEGAVLALRTDSHGESNVAAFLSSRSSRPSPPPRPSAPSVAPWAFLSAVGRLRVRDLAIVRDPGARLLVTVRRLRLGPASPSGVPLRLVLAAPQGGRTPASLALVGSLVPGPGAALALETRSLAARDPALFPGRVVGGSGRLDWLPAPGGGRLRLAPLRLVDRRFGRVRLEGEARLAGTRLREVRGTLRARILAAVVRRALPALRPDPAPAGLRLTARFVGNTRTVGPVPFRLVWGKGPARIAGRLSGTHRGARWCWSLVATGGGFGIVPSGGGAASASSSSSDPPAVALDAVSLARPKPGRRPAGRLAPVAGGSGSPGACLRVRARLADVRLASLPFRALGFTATVDGSRFSLRPFEAGIFGGTVDGRLRGRLVGLRPHRLVARMRWQGLDLALLSAALAPAAAPPLKGRVDGTAVVDAPDPLVWTAWRATGTLAGQGLVWEGVDLPALVRALGSLVHGRVPARWPSGGSTPVGRLRSVWRLRRGVLRFSRLVLHSPFLRVSGAGRAELVGGRRLDLRLDLTPSAGGKGWPPALEGTDLPVRVQGTLAHPRPVPDVPVILKRLLGRRLRGLLGGILGQD